MKSNIIATGAALLLALSSPLAIAAVSPEEAAKLGVSGTELTPNGAIRAGNADGMIPAWTGGITQPPPGFKWPNYIDPYASDKVLLTITAENYKQYADKLPEGYIAMFKKYPKTFKMDIYPTRRSWSAPDWVYAKTVNHATTVKLSASGNDPENNDGGGACFPIPKNGAEVRLNMTGWRCAYLPMREKRWYNSTVVDPQGGVQTAHIEEWHLLPRNAEDTPPFGSKDYDPYYYVMQNVVAPTRLANSAILLLANDNYESEGGKERIWSYNPGQRRVARAPQIAYDYPKSGSNGMLTTDQAYCGAHGNIDRYDYKMLPKAEMYVPYNNYKLYDRSLKVADVVGKDHLKPEYVRYELHRVIPVVATVKPGQRMAYAKRVFHVDEDSYLNLESDLYDRDGKLWRMEECMTMNYYDIPVFASHVEAKYDVRSNAGYVVLGLDYEAPSKPRAFDKRAGDFGPSFFTIGNLKGTVGIQ
jgi:hypothetical protein